MNTYDRLAIYCGISAILSAVHGRTNYIGLVIFAVCGTISIFMKRTKEQS